jgi:hypothetical protein
VSHSRSYRSLYLALWVAYLVAASLMLAAPRIDVLALLMLTSTAILGHAFLAVRAELARVRAEEVELFNRLLVRTVALPPAPKPTSVSPVRSAKTLASA